MTKRNHDLLRNVLDELCVRPIYSAACARCGISTKSLWRYVRASQCEDDPESYRLVWCDVEDWFHRHLTKTGDEDVGAHDRGNGSSSRLARLR
jgi:hypothetical protein